MVSGFQCLSPIHADAALVRLGFVDSSRCLAPQVRTFCTARCRVCYALTSFDLYTIINESFFTLLKFPPLQFRVAPPFMIDTVHQLRSNYEPNTKYMSLCPISSL